MSVLLIVLMLMPMAIPIIVVLAANSLRDQLPLRVLACCYFVGTIVSGAAAFWVHQTRVALEREVVERDLDFASFDVAFLFIVFVNFATLALSLGVVSILVLARR